MTPAEMTFLARAVVALAAAVLALAGSVTLMAVVTALGYWVEYKTWKQESQ